jgi:uncharacterized membrane protein
MVYITSILYILTNHQNGIHNHAGGFGGYIGWMLCIPFWWFVRIYRMDVMYTILVVLEDILDGCYVYHSGGL